MTHLVSGKSPESEVDAGDVVCCTFDIDVRIRKVETFLLDRLCMDAVE